MKLHRDPEVNVRIVLRPDPTGLVQTKRHVFSACRFFNAKKIRYRFRFHYRYRDCYN